MLMGLIHDHSEFSSEIVQMLMWADPRREPKTDSVIINCTVCKRVVNGILDSKLYVHNELVNVQYVYGYCVNCGIKLRFEYGYLYCPENELPDSD